MKSESESYADLEKYRRYLRFLARTHLSRRYHGKVDPSDVVQQALLKAIEAHHQFDGQHELQKQAWLRKILIRAVSHAVRDLHAQKRDISRERSIEREIEQSSMQLKKFLVDRQATPSQKIVKQETALKLAEAIEQLPEEQRTAIILKYWQALSLQEVAQEMNKSVPAVAGLLHRGTKQLKSCFR